MCQRPIVAQGCNLSVSPEIVAGRDYFAERDSVSRSTLGATTALDLSTRLAARTLLRVTDPRSSGCGFAALYQYLPKSLQHAKIFFNHGWTRINTDEDGLSYPCSSVVGS